MLRRSAEAIAAYTRQSGESALRLTREHALVPYRQKWIGGLEKSTRPALELIASRELTQSDRAEMVLLEAGLRDQIRGRALATADVLQAARKARRRGVRVDILEDGKKALPEDVMPAAVPQLVGALDQARNGTVRCRALQAGENPAVTILAFDESMPETELYVEIPEAAAHG